MRTLPYALVALLVLGLGCRANTSQVLVEQEARMLEDEVYHLEAQIEECCRSRKALELEVADLRRQVDGGPDLGGSSSGSDYRPPSERSRGTPPARRAPGPLVPPSIELPEPSDTPPADLFPADEQPAAVRGQPSRLSINKRLTGGMDRDSTGGDEGIMVMVEPRDEQGRLVNDPGAVSLVLMDPAQIGDAARIARWDFQKHEFDDHFKNSTFGQGLQYELSWPGEPPEHRDLVLFVRYMADDGTKLTTDVPLRIRLASDSPRIVRASAADGDEPSAIEEPEERDSPVREARSRRPEWKPYR